MEKERVDAAGDLLKSVIPRDSFRAPEVIEAFSIANGWRERHLDAIRQLRAQLAAANRALQTGGVTAARLKPNDGQRLQRALEVYELTGKPLSQWHAEQAPPPSPPYRFIQVALAPPERRQLHVLIERRFDEMLEQGLVAEVERLYTRGDLHAGLPSMKAVGYAQVWAYLEGACDRDEMRLRGIYATRQLAKRQHTWLRRFQQASCYDGAQAGLAGLLLKNWQADSTLAATRI